MYLIVVVGFLDIRVKQTGLIPSGGYIWGTYGMDQEKKTYDQLAEVLTKSPVKQALVLVNFPVDGKYATSMALFADSGLQRILVYNSATRTYLSNDLAGERPPDGLATLNDAQAYNWNIPIILPESAKMELQDQATWIEFDNEIVRPIAPVR